MAAIQLIVAFWLDRWRSCLPLLYSPCSSILIVAYNLRGGFSGNVWLRFPWAPSSPRSVLALTTRHRRLMHILGTLAFTVEDGIDA